MTQQSSKAEPTTSGTDAGHAAHSIVSGMLRYLGSIGFALWILVLALRPDPGFSAPLPWMALFWFAHISIGLLVLPWVFYLLSRSSRLNFAPLWCLVILSGVAASVMLAPLYWLLGEGLMLHTLGFPVTTDGPYDPGVLLPFGWRAVLEEFGDIIGPVTAAWMVVSWPRLPGLLPPLLLPQAAGIATAPLEAGSVVEPDEADGAGLSVAGEAAPVQQATWRAALPAELGDDLIAIRSELQYLRIWTARGTALVLGALQDVEEQEGGAGLRVHRSWWVHARHVRGVRRSGDGAVCLLSDGREIPVSRRRKAEVLARFGDGARYDIAPSPTGLPKQLP